MGETGEITGATAPAEMVEVVIITGQRRGEIVRLPADTVSNDAKAAIQLLNLALEEASASIERTSRELRELRTALNSGLDKLQGQLYDMRERLARLEASREADQAVMQAHLNRLELEAERAGLPPTRHRPT